MNRTKEAWDDIWKILTLTAQTLRDSTIRFRYDKLLLNLIKVRDGNGV